MVCLSPVFSSGALFLQNAVTDLRGTAAPHATVTATLASAEKAVRQVQTQADENGRFVLPLPGEAASFTPYTVTISDGEDETVLDDILFGEVWLAAGQSNMVLKNHLMNEHAAMLEEIAAYPIRCYQFERIMGGTGYRGGPYPFTPQDDGPGRWYNATDTNGFLQASAAATAAALSLAKAFQNEGKEVPIGFLDLSVGGSPIEAWTPLSITEEERYASYLKVFGHYTAPEDRNIRPAGPPDRLHRQQSVLFNTVVAPVIGMKLRGILWYQGEDNIAANHLVRAFYRYALERYHEAYEELFSPDCSQPFPMLCTLLFPWHYGADASVRRANIDLAILDTVRAHPTAFGAFPIHDLPPRWSYDTNGGGIHPTNKYEVGRRFAELMLRHAYGKKGGKTAPYFKRAVRKKGAIELSFETFGKPLTASGEPHGFFVCGKNGIYFPADAKIIGRNRILVSHPYIDIPRHVCYQLGDLQQDGNVMADGLPLSPFATDRENAIKVPLMPWSRASQTAQLTWRSDPFAYLMPTRYPAEGTALTLDTTVDPPATRLVPTDSRTTLGMVIRAERTMPIPLNRCTGLAFSLFCRPEVEVSVCLTLRCQGAVSERILRVAKTYSPINGRIDCRVSFRLPADAETERITFRFDTAGLLAPTLAVGDIILIPKKH